MSDRSQHWTVTVNQSNSVIYDALRALPNHTRDDVRVACRYLAFGRRDALIALYTQLLASALEDHSHA